MPEKPIKQKLEPGLHDLVVPITTYGSDGENQLVVQAWIRGLGDAAALVVDSQRDYGRTWINGDLMPGEAVVELRVEKE